MHYSQLPQGLVHSPSIFKVLAEDLQHLDVQSATLMYVDDILICSERKEQCEKDSITVLKHWQQVDIRLVKTSCSSDSKQLNTWADN